jgi:hypothetical protein
MTYAFSTSSHSLSSEMLARIRRAYAIGMENFQQSPESMWWSIDEARRGTIHSAMRDCDDRELSDLLCNPTRHDLLWGIDVMVVGIHDSVAGINGSVSAHPPDITDADAAALRGMLDTLGAEPLANPENGQVPPPLDADRMVECLDRALGVSVGFPNPLPGEYGLCTSRGLLSFRVPQAICHAYRTAVLLKAFGGTGILEIGPGLGRVAYFARLLGVTDYTTVDLPLGIVAQAVWLSATLGEDAIWLPGDEAPQTNRIRLLLPHMLRDEEYTVALNSDSLTEMSDDQAIGYFSYLSRNVRVFLSTNHEANRRKVKELPSLCGIDVVPFRSLSAVRAGYVDDLFIFRHAGR